MSFFEKRLNCHVERCYLDRGNGIDILTFINHSLESQEDSTPHTYGCVFCWCFFLISCLFGVHSKERMIQGSINDTLLVFFQAWVRINFSPFLQPKPGVIVINSSFCWHCLGFFPGARFCLLTADELGSINLQEKHGHKNLGGCDNEHLSANYEWKANAVMHMNKNNLLFLKYTAASTFLAEWKLGKKKKTLWLS